MKSTTILVAEDDPNILNGLVDTIESEGYRALPARDGDEALNLFHAKQFDLVILDIMMPGKNGYEVCKLIRQKNQKVPIIMLTAKGEEIDKVVGLQLGADDYITKPFGIHELLARIAACLRRAGTAGSVEDKPVRESSRFMLGSAEIDPLQYKGRLGQKTFSLSARELDLALFFFDHPNEVLSRDRILNAVWGIDYYGTTRTLDQHVAKLRKKIEVNPANPGALITVHGLGYRYQTG